MHVSNLTMGDRIRIKQDFADFDNQRIKAGQEMVFLDQSYFPYEGGYTLRFEHGEIRLAELSDDNALVIRNELDEYFELIQRSGE